MNLLMPVSAIMNRNAPIVLATDSLNLVKDIFARKTILHIPVMHHSRVVGIISRNDFQSFQSGLDKSFDNPTMTQSLLRSYIAEEIMNNKVTFLEPTDRLNVALEMLRDNIFTALPVLEGEKLVGLINALDVVKALAKEKAVELHYQIF
jgi:CBS domain-containing membrane protein